MVVVDGHGVKVTDSEGKTWIDVNGGYASVNVGYGRTEIAEAAYEQVRQLTYVPQRTSTAPTAGVDETRAETTP